MTYQELVEIRGRLGEWCNDRHLSLESQQIGYIGNVLEELTEYARAKTIFEQVDALCDIIVFSINATDSQRQILLEKYADHDIKASPEKLAKAVLDGIDDGLIVPSYFSNPVCVCVNVLRFLGFNPYKCLDETLKEIESRTGKYDIEIKKFVKDKGAYSLSDFRERCPELDDYEVIEQGNSFFATKGNDKQIFAKWYQADYKRCAL